jgi:MFS family permease
LFQLGPLAAALGSGALAGGFLADRLGHVRVAWCSLLALIVFNLLLGAVGEVSWLALVVIVAEYAVIGIFTASSYALFMDIASAGLKATLFSAFTGATNACEAFSALAAGRLAVTFSFSAAFTMMTLPSLVALAILPWLRKRP